MPQLRPFHELVAASRNTEAAVKDEKVEKAKRLLDENQKHYCMYFLRKCPNLLRFPASLWIQAQKSKKPFLFETWCCKPLGLQSCFVLSCDMLLPGCNIFNSKELWKDSNDPMIVKLQGPRMGRQAVWRCWQQLAQLTRFSCDAAMPCLFQSSTPRHFGGFTFWQRVLSAGAGIDPLNVDRFPLFFWLTTCPPSTCDVSKVQSIGILAGFRCGESPRRTGCLQRGQAMNKKLWPMLCNT